MPYDDPDPQDPMFLVGVSLPGGPDTARDMVYAFAEELARLGYGATQILEIFRSPYYAGAHRAWRLLGEAEMKVIVAETVGVWGRLRPVDRGAPGEAVVRAGETDHD
jgi:hypothetical protein